tara:strand:+ start:1034 stop:1711 length:678 start_codon:yes stop_codon:yes gene_type:complete
MQRFFDILLSLMAILVLSPVLVPVLLILRFTGEREIFYLQARMGKNNNKFNLLKFATMLKNSDQMKNGTVTVRDDPRVLPFGKFLRKSKINELPQLFNILLGHMSVIGPRPQTPNYFDNIDSETQKILLHHRPGLSGIGSIVFRNEEDILFGQDDHLDYHDRVLTPYKTKLELWYFKKRSLLYYFAFIFITAYVVVSKESNLHWKIFKDIPQPPDQLKNHLGHIK